MTFCKIWNTSTQFNVISEEVVSKSKIKRYYFHQTFHLSMHLPTVCNTPISETKISKVLFIFGLKSSKQQVHNLKLQKKFSG